MFSRELPYRIPYFLLKLELGEYTEWLMKVPLEAVGLGLCLHVLSCEDLKEKVISLIPRVLISD